MKLLNTLKKGKRWAGFLLVALIPLIAEAQVSLSIPDTTLRAGETINVPVYVNGLGSSLGVISGEFEFNFNSSIFEITGVEKSGSVLQSVGNVLYFSGTKKLAFASTDTVSGEGILVYLKIKGREVANYFQSSTLNFVSATFNEGSPIASTSNGSVQIEGVSISPKSGIRLVKGDSLQFNLTQDVTNPVSWSVTDTSRATIDSNGLLITKETGQIQVKGVDANGLADSTQFFSILPENFSDLTVTLPDTFTTQTLSLDLPINVTDLTGLGVLSAEFDISFNQNYFTVEEVLPGELTTSWGNPAVNIDQNRIQIAGAGSDTLVGAGALYYIRLRTKNTISGSTTVTLNSSAFNEDLSATNENSTITVNLAPVIEIVPGDTSLSIGNNLQFNVGSSNGTPPYTWESSDPSIGSIDSNTGILTGVTRGDITITARDAENFPSGIVNVRVNDFDAYLDSTLLIYPDTANISLFTSDLTSYGLTSFEMEFQYDSTKLDFIGVSLDNTLTGDAGLSIEVRDTSNVIKIAGAGTTMIASGKSLIDLKFAPKNAIVHEDSIDLYLQTLTFNEPSPSVPTVTTLPGLISVQRIDPPVAPALATPIDGALDQDTLITFDWVDVAEADFYRFQLSTDSTFTTFFMDSVLNVSSISLQGINFNTSYYWRVLASNVGGDSPWTSVFNFETRIQEPEVPVILNPADSVNQADTVAFFGWNKAPRADTYQLQISTTEDFSVVNFDLTGLTDTVAQESGLDYLTRYFWRLRAVNAGGNSDWTVTRTFVTKAKPAVVPILLSPTDNAVSVDTATTLIWTKAEANTSYQVQLSTTSDFSTTILDVSQVDTTLGVTELSRFTDHFWRVRSVGFGGDTSAWSGAFTFLTVNNELPAPILRNPTKDAVGLSDTLTFQWSTVSGADGYMFELSDDTSTTDRLEMTALSDTSITVDSLMYSTTYLWRVKSTDSVTPRESVWSPWFAFTTRSAPAVVPMPLTPSDNATDVDTALTLLWSSNAANIEYQVQLSTSSDFSSTLLDVSGVDTTAIVDGLTRLTEHFWRVRGVGADSDTSAWSPNFSFTTADEIDLPPIVTSLIGTVILEEDFVDTTVVSLDSVFTDPEGGSLSFSIESTTDLVNAQLNANSLILSSVADTSGTGEIIILARDDEGLEAQDTLKVTITPVNDLPFAIQLPDTITFVSGEVFNLRVDTIFKDVEDLIADLDISVQVDPTDIFVSYNLSTFTVSLTSPGYTGFGSIKYTVTDTDGGVLEVSSVLEVTISISSELESGVPNDYVLNQNYPNPFNPTSTISFGLPEISEVKLDVFNMLGQKVATLIDGRIQAGWHSVEFNASSLSTGTYIYRIQVGSFIQTKKMMLIK